MSDAVDVAALLRSAVATVEAALRALPARHATAPPRLVEAMQYSLTAGGKRLRPALVLEAARACAGGGEVRGSGRIEGFRVHGSDVHAAAPANSPSSTEPRTPNPPPSPSVLAAAVAIELVHTFSLVHDDLPAMDDDDLRRGRPTNHVVFGEAMAILAGDAMVAVAFEVLATDADPAVVPALVAELARATGPCGMIGGQVLDIDGENAAVPIDALRRTHAMKTGALLTAACRTGAIAAGASDAALAAATSFGRHLGLAFQIVDDLLDVTATPAQLGKATHKDAGRGKTTYPKLLGLDATRAAAAEQLRLALAAVEPLGPAADGLRAIARYVVERDV